MWSSKGDTKSGESSVGEARLEVKEVFESLGLARESVEIVCWDRDLVGSEYMGVVGLSIENWWNSGVQDLEAESVPIGFSDEANKVRLPNLSIISGDPN